MAVLEADDELRTIKLVHRSLMKLKPEARRRVVRYMTERHVVATEPEPGLPQGAEGAGPLTAAESVAEAKRQLGTSA